MMRGADLHPKDHSIQLFTDASNEGWGTQRVCGQTGKNSGSLHKQTRNSLSRDVRSPVEDHDMVTSLSHNIWIEPKT